MCEKVFYVGTNWKYNDESIHRLTEPGSHSFAVGYVDQAVGGNGGGPPEATLLSAYTVVSSTVE